MTLLALLGSLAQWLAWRFRLPAIVLLTAAGLLAGPALGWLDPRATFGELLDPLLSLAVAVILFEGGLALRLADLKEKDVARAVRRLCSLGLLLAFALGTAAARWVGDLSWPTAACFGAITVVTGPTVIIPLLRQARLRRRSAALFQWEGIVNDPFGALLAVVVFQLATGDTTASGLARFALALLGGGGLGAAAGWLLGRAFRAGLVPEYQKAPALLGAVLCVAWGGNAIAHEAGLLSVTVMGVVIGNAGLASIDDLLRFKEGVTLFLVSAVFLVLTAALDPATLGQLDLRAAALLGAMLLVVRPLAVLLSTIGSGVDMKERLLLGWIAPRGVVAAAVSGVFGPALVQAGHPDAELLAPLVFALIVVTVVLHGFSLPWLARHLGLAAKTPQGLLVVGASGWTVELGKALAAADVPVVVADTSWRSLSRARMAGLDVFFGEVLSEHGEHGLPLHTLGTVLAATDNDAYNALVCVHFGPHLGRDQVFQLAPTDHDPDDPRSVSHTRRGRLAVDEDATLELLDERNAEGWTFQRTTFSEDFGLEDWRAGASPQARPVALLRDGDRLALLGREPTLKAGPGDVLLSFAPPKTPSA